MEVDYFSHGAQIFKNFLRTRSRMRRVGWLDCWWILQVKHDKYFNSLVISLYICTTLFLFEDCRLWSTHNRATQQFTDLLDWKCLWIYYLNSKLSMALVTRYNTTRVDVSHLKIESTPVGGNKRFYALGERIWSGQGFRGIQEGPVAQFLRISLVEQFTLMSDEDRMIYPRPGEETNWKWTTKVENRLLL